jgi:hypothetical protein
MGVAPFTAFYQFIPDNVCSQLQNDLFRLLYKETAELPACCMEWFFDAIARLNGYLA